MEFMFYSRDWQTITCFCMAQLKTDFTFFRRLKKKGRICDKRQYVALKAEYIYSLVLYKKSLHNDMPACDLGKGDKNQTAGY